MTSLDNARALAAEQPRGHWLGQLEPKEKRALTASFGGYAVDAFDYYTLPHAAPPAWAPPSSAQAAPRRSTGPRTARR